MTHHKSTLLIAGMFSFMNAGSGSNQSNHMYKLGPIHQGIMERGAKTSSDSYLLWPAKIGAFSLVMGRHVSHLDTSNLPFSYLIEQQSTSYIFPGVNLKSVGTIRDARKWPKRDGRAGPDILDCINYNLLSPFTVQKMFRALDILEGILAASGEVSDVYSYMGAKIRSSSLKNGIRYYNIAINKFLGNSIIKRLEDIGFPAGATKEERNAVIRGRLRPDMPAGDGEWVDVSGMIAPKQEVEALLDDIENGAVSDVYRLHSRFEEMHSHYYDYEWTWAYNRIRSFYGIEPSQITVSDVIGIVERWKEAVVGLDRMVYEDARKEFSLFAMTSFGADGDADIRSLDFAEVRGGQFESNPFVMETLDHIKRKTALGDELISRLAKVR